MPSPTLLHRYWTCGGLSKLEDPHGWISRSQKLLPRIEGEWLALECMWSRGILPAAFFSEHVGEEVGAAAWRSSAWNQIATEEQRCYADGWGAPADAPPALVDAVCRRFTLLGWHFGKALLDKVPAHLRSA